MAKHRQTATGRRETGAKKTKGGDSAESRASSPIREISLVRKAGDPLNNSAVPSRTTSAYPSRAPSPTPRQPFRFLELPSELRLRIYKQVFHLPDAVDLDGFNYRRILPRLNLFLVSRQIYAEAYHVFYAQPIRLFPHRDAGRFFNTKKPLLQRLPTKYREAITCVEMRLGSGWHKPPACQNTWNEGLGLRECTNLRVLKIFVECDPSDNIFAGFRGKHATEETYKYFCIDLLQGIMQTVPSLETVEIDAYPPITKDSPLVAALTRQVQEARKRLIWGPLRGWDDGEVDLVEFNNLVGGMQSMSLSPQPGRIVEIQA